MRVRTKRGASIYPQGHYVYALIDPRNGKRFYVGKGQGSRAWDHERDVIANRVPYNSAKSEIIAAILSAGMHPNVQIIASFTSARDAEDLERTIIASIPDLANVVRWGVREFSASPLKLIKEGKNIQISPPRQERDDRVELTLHNTTIGSDQIRAARVLLGWSQQQLAEAAKLGLSTVKKGEVDVATINGRSIIALEEALTSAGIVFLSDRDDPRIRKGVGLRR